MKFGRERRSRQALPEANLKQKEKLLAEAEAEAKAKEVDGKLKRLKKTKVESSSEYEEDVRQRRVKREPVS